MRKQFIQLTSGWIPVSVLGLFAAALVAGQARANLPNEIRAVPAITTSVNVVLNDDMLQRLEALPIALGTLIALPSDLGVSIDIGFISEFDTGEHSSRTTSE